MGMQCQFYMADLPDCNVQRHYHKDSDTCSAEIKFVQKSQYDILEVNADDELAEFWFDCGHGSQFAMDQIKALILNGVPFTCS